MITEECHYATEAKQTFQHMWVVYDAITFHDQCNTYCDFCSVIYYEY